MSFKNILVPYDNSEHAKNALKEAVDLAKNLEGSSVHVVEVAAPPQDLVYSSINQTGFGMGVSVASQGDFAQVVEQRNEESDRKLQESITSLVEDFEGELTAEVVFGIYTIETIIDAAKHYDCDLIVMGSRGLGAIRGAIGSVSYGILRSVDIPVLVVK
ncbi:MAG: universal stress protein [Eggerthellaceae bacterium]